jgi:hypothetical protein
VQTSATPWINLWCGRDFIGECSLDENKLWALY